MLENGLDVENRLDVKRYREGSHHGKVVEAASGSLFRTVRSFRTGNS